MENTFYKWHLYGPTYTKSGICFALSEDGVRSQLKSRGYVAADRAIVQQIDTNCSLHVLTETDFHADKGCN